MTTARNTMGGFTDFEEGIEFDLDDPDFDSVNNNRDPSMITNFANHVTLTSEMSVASVHPSGLSNRSQSFGSISSLDDIHGSYYSTTSEAVLSIEELRLQLNSCFTCGVSWIEDHVSLDCSECGGYSLERPCPMCDGKCSSTWKRDLTMSHACGKARWEGKCQLRTSQKTDSTVLLLKPLSPEEETRLCSRLEKLAASS
uniref:Protein pinocchio n=2 Tax=Clastoptera arizonana TaxID=38151 RepID=A0A1B6CDG4_9HEMI